MLFVLLIWAYIFVFSFLTGIVLVNYINPLERDNNNAQFNSIEFSIIGLFTLAALASLWSIAFPVNHWTHFVLWTLLILSLSSKYSGLKSFFQYIKSCLTPKKDKATIIFMSLAVVLIIYLLGKAHIWPKNSDSALYHIQAVKWINNFGTVIGLGNVHARLAFNSNAFHLNALFSGNGMNLSNNFFFVNSYLFTSTILLLIKNAFEIRQSLVIKFVWLVTAAMLMFFFTKMHNWISSPTPDVTFNCFLVFLLTWLFTNDVTSISRVKWMLFLIFLPFLFTIKLSLAPLILLVFLLPKPFIKSLSKIDVLKFIIVLLIFILPYFINNIKLSGYLLYPAVEIDFFNFNWEVNKVVSEKVKAVISSWAKVRSSTDPGSLQDWVPVWYNMRHNPKFLFLVKVAACVPILLLLSLLKVNKLFKTNNSSKHMRILLGVLYLNLLFWFYTAPDFRFAAVLIIFLSSIVIATFLIPLFKYLPSQSHLYLIIALFFGLSYYFKFYKRLNYDNFVIHEIYDREYEIFKQNDIPFVKPIKGGFGCHDNPLPCTHETLVSDEIKLRGDSFKNGFTNEK